VTTDLKILLHNTTDRLKFPCWQTKFVEEDLKPFTNEQLNNSINEKRANKEGQIN
jgi:hypothetical protein